METASLASLIRTIPDWPKPGILFYDITTLLADARGFHTLIESMSSHWQGQPIDAVVGVEARGFIIGPALALNLNAGFIPVRKPAKLPWRTEEVTYDLEYGTDTLQIHADALQEGMRVLVCDDLLATGGTAAATVDLCRTLRAEVVGAAFAVELSFLNGRARLAGLDVQSAVTFDA
jgi:adenine phosphoribosyltransferase